MISSEQNDFFVFRKKRQVGKREEIRNVVSLNMRGIEIETTETNYLPSSDNISRVRIPSLLYIINRTKSDEYYVFKTSDRKQVGSHLFATNRGFLSYLKTYLDENHKYHVSSTARIHGVYPCFLNTDSGYQMCIGLRYTSNMSGGNRTFGRIVDNQTPSGGVFDLMEDFLNPKRIKTGIESEENRQLFERNQCHYAIYVCAGAKLIVEDNRFDVMSKVVKSNYNRSLFQPGSLIVFSCELNLELPVGINNETLDQKGVKKVSFEWKESAEKGLLKPHDTLYQNWFKHRGLNKSKEQVIFLGASYSHNNSICWRLRLDSPKEGCRAIAALTAPEGGRIIDIQTWDWGWAEIYWRHRYERLYEKVLIASDPTKFVQKPYLTFHIPTVSEPNPYYWEKKILGIGPNFNSWLIKFSYQYEDQKALVVPSFYEQYIDWTDMSSIHPFPPPLNPPIYSNSQFLYLPYKTYPRYLSESLVEISGEIYKIMLKDAEEYLWTDPKRVSSHPNVALSADQRLGLDLMVYSKHNVIIGRKRFIYFELNSLHTKSVEFVPNEKQQTELHEEEINSETKVRDANKSEQNVTQKRNKHLKNEWKLESNVSEKKDQNNYNDKSLNELQDMPTNDEQTKLTTEESDSNKDITKFNNIENQWADEEKENSDEDIYKSKEEIFESGL